MWISNRFRAAFVAGIGLSLLGQSAFSQIDLRLTEIAQAQNITDIRNAGDGSGRLFLVTITGEVFIFRDGAIEPEPFLDISDKVKIGMEEGLLSLAFAPDYEQSGQFYVYYSRLGETLIERYTVSADPDRADVSSGMEFSRFIQPFANHNGGRLIFGHDDHLYLSLGDGGGGGDPEENGQDGSTLLGSILRFFRDDAGNLQIPTDNPFVGDPSTRDAIWAIGLRNPYRISLDSLTGDLFIADVGQANIEEINFQPAGVGGQNYGWNFYEGNVCFNSAGCSDTSGLTFPVFQYRHDEGCSITGGEVYRGSTYPALDGMYFYGDFCSGTVWGLRNENGQWVNRNFGDSGVRIISFGTDERGDIYMGGGGRLFLLSDGDPVIGGVGLPMDGSYSGTYIVNGLNDQGFFVQVGEQSDGQVFLFVAWFTYRNGEPFWIVGNTFFDRAATTIGVPMQELSGLNFLAFSDMSTATRDSFGTMSFTAVDCDNIESTYDFGTNGSGQLSLIKLTGIEGRECQ